jgi:hypothetical protein
MRHESIAYYEPDVTVSDVEESSQRPSRRRYGEELTMQVYVEGRWHRRTPDLKTTACGKPYHAQFCNPRRESYQGDICRGDEDGRNACFTPYELALNDQVTADEHAQEAADRKPLHRTGEYEKSASDWIAEPTKPRTKTKPNGSK